MAKKKIPKNSPCPCGSGKKYKACCLKKEEAHRAPPDLLWRKLRQADGKLAHQLIKYARNAYGEGALYEAWGDFVNYRKEKTFDFRSPHNQAFFPWFLFNWRREEWGDEDVSQEDDAEALTIAESYLDMYRRRLSEMERRLIELCCAQDFSFHEVLDCQPGRGFTLKDILLEREIYVTEQSGSQPAQKGDILFAKVVHYDRIGLLAGCGPVLIPPRYKPFIIDLRASMRSESGSIAERHLYEWDVEIRDLYFEIYDQMHTPPKLCNTDGDPLCMHDLYFEITSPQVAFERLKPLALDIPEDELLEDGEFDDDGNLTKIHFRWVKKGRSKIPGGDYTTLGQIAIEDRELRVSVNSKNRAVKIRREIEKRLGNQVIHRATEVKSVESLLDKKLKSPQEDHAPEMTPELEAYTDQIFDSHWKQWLDEKIPALGGITPRQAIKDKDGREKVIALLDDFERREKRAHDGLNQLKYVQRVRKQLGLE